MSPADPRRRDEALAWVRRIQDPHFADWPAHADWLEADPRNPGAFDAMASLIDDATIALSPAIVTVPVSASNDNGAPPVAPGPRRRWLGVGLGLAAAAGIAGVVTLPGLLHGGPQSYAIETAPGETRALALADGSRITLNGGSSVQLDRGDPRVASLDRGEAYFTIVHDPAHPFTVRAGDAVFQDVGTAFDVVRDPHRTRLAVHDGAVLYDPAGTAVRLAPGDAIEIAAGEATVRRVDAAAVGGWRAGRLTFADAPMEQVAADLARSIGQPVRIDGDAAALRFSGVIVLDPDRARMFRRVAAIAGVGIRHDDGGWRMALPAR